MTALIISCFSSLKPINTFSLSTPKFAPFQQKKSKLTQLRAYYYHSSRKKWGFFEVGKGKDGILMKKREVFVRFNQGFGFNGGGDGGGDGGGNSGRVIGNLVLAVGLTYLTLSGQLGWVLDAIVSFWLFAIIAPIVGLGVFLWWAGRDIVQSNCPNCGNEFQVFKSTLTEELQLCPYCSAPFSVEDGKFVRDPVKFSKGSTPFGQTFNDFPSSFKKGKDSNTTVVDVEAEIRDAD